MTGVLIKLIPPPQTMVDYAALVDELRDEIDRYFHSGILPSRHNVTEKIVTASQSDPLDPY